MYCAKDIAKYFLYRAKKDGVKDVTSQKINKLVFIAHGWTLSALRKVLILNDIQAWLYGVIIPDLYFEYKDNGRDPLPLNINDIDFIKEDDILGGF